ncbi:hypothetical protein EDB87DRAFT_1686549 [Lactarius vividus]|nr:hypothetical protein EDB87DRAFT_1686549 [Lactarius vividus]
MSHTIYEATDAPEAELGGYSYPPPSGPMQEAQGEPKFIDGSGPIFSIYLEMAEEEDKKMVEGWKADADGILIFTGLFSAAVASLISVSIQDIRQNPQDTSNFYLANIYQTISDPNRFNTSSSLPTSPPEFSPPNYAVWVNSLWFLSLAISLTCALLATLLQQWARKYLKVTQPRYSPHKRARIRTFFFEGVEKFFLPWSVEVLPTLLHASLFLFFAGLVVFLYNANFTIFKLVVSWVGICTTLYGYITFMPLFRHDSPYCTPLSSSAWYIVTGASCITFRALQKLASLVNLRHKAYDRFLDLEIHFHRSFAQGMLKTAEVTALNSPSEFDTRAFVWTFESLDEDHELERFFSGLPGFRNSQVVNDPLPSLTEQERIRLFEESLGLLNRTFSSDLLPESDKNRRAISCAKAMSPTDIPYEYQWILDKIIYQHEGLCTSEFGRIVRGWTDNGLGGNQGTAVVVRAILTYLVAKAQRRNDSWFILTSGELSVLESVLRDYAAHGDSLSLSVLIYVTRQHFSLFRDPSWPSYLFTGVLETISKFDPQDTSPELQREFCALWNQIVLKAQNDDDQAIASYILGRIRNVYIALHRGTGSAPTRFSPSTIDYHPILDDPTSYPRCNVPGHHLDSTPRVPGDSVSTADNAALAPNLDLSSSSISAPLRVAESLIEVPTLDSFRQITTEGHCIVAA